MPERKNGASGEKLWLPGMTHQACIGLGSNIRPEENLRRAVEMLRQRVAVEALSSVWETPPIGARGPNFLNAAMRISTPLSQPLLKTLVLRWVEAKMGRVRTFNKFAPRPIDLDIVIFDGRLIHPDLWEQAYLAVPVAEIFPGYAHPVTGETVAQAAERLRRTANIKPRPEVWRGLSGER